LATRPFDDDLGFDVELFARVADSIVMVAAHCHRALIHQVDDSGNRPFRVGTVADIVTQQYGPLRAKPAGLFQAGAESPSVGVNIREQCETHR
jgi:hypothetical protein